MSSLDDWDYDLPPDRVARFPASTRDGSRLLWAPIDGSPAKHLSFPDICETLRPGDLLVANNTRVMAARLRARRATGGAVELLVLSVDKTEATALARPARKIRSGEVLNLVGGGTVSVHPHPDGGGKVSLRFVEPAEDVLDRHGEMPLPPYLNRKVDTTDRDRYQTVYAGPLGSSAAPTAGLHFTAPLLQRLTASGVGFATVTLHVGLGTFRPLRGEDIERGTLHSEWFCVPTSTVEAIFRTKQSGGRVIAVGTTSARSLESAARGSEGLKPAVGQTDLFIQPPYRFRVIDGLLTNFHLPRSSLLMLVGSLIGRRRLLDLYGEAIARKYRFYSYGDAMLLL